VQNIRGKRDQPVRLLHVRGDLGQIAVRREADRAPQGGPGVPLHRQFDLSGKLERVQQILLSPHQRTGHLVDRKNSRHGNTKLHRLDDAMVIVDVLLVAGLDELETGAHPLCVPDLDPRLNTEDPGLVAGGDAARRIGHYGNDGHGLAAEMRLELLLNRSEIAVQIEKEPAHQRLRRMERIAQHDLRSLRAPVGPTTSAGSKPQQSKHCLDQPIFFFSSPEMQIFISKRVGNGRGCRFETQDSYSF
jgi:hypothetical protein